MSVRRMSVPYTLEANGVVTPLANANVTSQVDGIVMDVSFTEGQEVAKGQVLFKVDPRPYENAYQQSRAQLARDYATWDNAQHAYERYNQLAAQRVITLEDLENRRATATSALATIIADSANLATAKFNLDNTTIRAPIGGRTGGLLVKAGNVVRAAGNAPLVVINQVRPILVRFAVPGSQLPMIQHYGGKGGLPVTATPTAASASSAPPPGSTPRPLDASPGAGGRGTPVNVVRDTTDPPPTGTLFFIDNAVDTTTGTVQLKARFDNKSGTMWPGQFVQTSLRLFVEDSAIVVPSQCVVTGQRGTFVFVIDSSNTAEQRAVTVERQANGMSVIATGLAAGERIVTDGQSRLTNGATVDLRSAAADGGGRGMGRGGRGGGRGGRGKKGGDKSGGAPGDVGRE